MNETEIKGRAEEEHKRIIAILCDAGVSKKRIDMLLPVIENTSWMKAKLDDAREAIKNSNIVIAYDNGGGQRGIRENPLFKGYEGLWRSYMAGMSKIIDVLPEEAAVIVNTEASAPKTTLELIRERHKSA